MVSKDQRLRSRALLADFPHFPSQFTAMRWHCLHSGWVFYLYLILSRNTLTDTSVR